MTDARFEELVSNLMSGIENDMDSGLDEYSEATQSARAALVVCFDERTAERDAARRELCKREAIEKCPGQLGVATGKELFGLPIVTIPRRRDREYWERDYAASREWSYLYEAKP